MVDVAFERVKVLANTFVVVRAFEAKMFPVTPMVDVAFERVKVLANTFEAKMFPDDFIESTFEKFP